MQIVLLDSAAWPQARHQLVLGDDAAPRRGEQAQNIERAPGEPHRLLIMQQLAPAEIEPETAEPDLPWIHRLHAIAC